VQAVDSPTPLFRHQKAPKADKFDVMEGRPVSANLFPAPNGLTCDGPMVGI
jgi:hypothetical protein